MKDFLKKNKVYVIGIVLALFVVVSITVTSYAYFSANVNSGSINPTVVTTGSMEIEFSDGPEVVLERTLPGSYVEKTFSVKNVGTQATNYDIYLSDLINTFEDNNDLKYTLTSSNGANVSQTTAPLSSSKIVSNQELPLGATHTYTLRIDFIETNDNQDDNKGKVFSTIVRVNEVKDSEFIASGVTYSSEYTSVTNVQDALDELATLLR